MPAGPQDVSISSRISSVSDLTSLMAVTFLIFRLCALPNLVLAAPTPTQNLTALRTEIAPPWVSDPNNRGTWSLLYSCTFTLALCVWTAIHLNVPAHEERQLSQLLRKAKWDLLAILAPELGVYTAWEQYSQARDLALELDECSRDARNSVSKTIVQPAGPSSKSQDVRQPIDSNNRDRSE